MAETQKERIMRSLGVSAEEAEAIMAEDKAIDRGERMDFDLSPEAEKAAKKQRTVAVHTTETVRFIFQRFSDFQSELFSFSAKAILSLKLFSMIALAFFFAENPPACRIFLAASRAAR